MTAHRDTDPTASMGRAEPNGRGGPKDQQVLIVGAGPTGLTMAVELARRGVGVRVIDRGSGPNTETRALGMQARTLELLERPGITDEVLAHGLRADRFNVFSEGKRILLAEFGGLGTAYPFLLMIPQNETERILEAHLASLGVFVERTTALATIAQTTQAVRVGIAGAGGRHETATFDWVIGADGAHSTVRSELGIGFLGSSFEERFAVADLRVGWDRPPEEFFAFLNRGRFAAFFPMPGGWHRVAIARPPAPTSPEDRSITTELLQAAIDATVPGRAPIEQVRQSGRFHIDQRRAEKHRKGRVFLIGDAAHVHSVIGAQGMNTGMQDAFNLGWKLAAVLQGRADTVLLDSYPEERSPVAARLVRGTRAVTRMTLLSNPVPTFLRRTVAPLVLSRPRVRSALVRAISQLDVSYHDGKGSAPRNRTEVGDRAPDSAIVAGGTQRLHQLLHPTDHTVLAAGLTDASLAELANAGIPIVRVALNSPVAQVYGITAPTAVVIRPDGYLAGRCDPAEVPQLISGTRPEARSSGVSRSRC